MGYNSQLTFEDSSEVKIKNIDKLNKQIEKADLRGFWNTKILLDKDGFYIELEDYFGKFYDDDKFAILLSKYLTKGTIKLFFIGEDGERWGWEITPNEVHELYCKVEWIREPENIAGENIEI